MATHVLGRGIARNRPEVQHVSIWLSQRSDFEAYLARCFRQCKHNRNRDRVRSSTGGRAIGSADLARDQLLHCVRSCTVRCADVVAHAQAKRVAPSSLLVPKSAYSVAFSRKNFKNEVGTVVAKCYLAGVRNRDRRFDLNPKWASGGLGHETPPSHCDCRR